MWWRSWCYLFYGFFIYEDTLFIKNEWCIYLLVVVFCKMLLRRNCITWFYDCFTKESFHKDLIVCIFICWKGACGGNVVISCMIFIKRMKFHTKMLPCILKKKMPADEMSLPLLWFSIKNMGKPQQYVPFHRQGCFHKCHRQDLFAAPGMGIGVGE